MKKYAVRVLIETVETWIVEAPNEHAAEANFEKGILMQTDEYKWKRTLNVKEVIKSNMEIKNV